MSVQIEIRYNWSHITYLMSVSLSVKMEVVGPTSQSRYEAEMR